MAQKKGSPTNIKDLSGGLQMSTSNNKPTAAETAAAAIADNARNTPWLAFINDEVGRTMYYNTLTEETTWDKPAVGFEWGEAFPGRTPNVDPEGLGNDYLDTPWVKPSLEQAIMSGELGICLGGKASLCASISAMNSIGASGIIYFHLLKTLTSTFFVMSLLYLPLIVTNYYGNRIPGDQLHFSSVFSIANTGTFRSEYKVCTIAKPDREACEQRLWEAGDQFLGSSPFWPSGGNVEQVAATYVWLDLGAMIVFATAMVHFYIETNTFTRMYRLRTTTTSDYSIQVWGLPPDALESEIIDHFNDLYNLQHEDHVGRPKSDPELNPVGHYGNTCDRKYYISWVAECTTAHPTGNSIRKYKQHDSLSLKLR